jgi:dynein heavy chain
MCLNTEVLKKRSPDEITAAPREGAYVHGLFMEGARWDEKAGCIKESRLKEMFSPMPVILVKAVTVEKQETRDMYSCPVYKTRNRGPTFVEEFNLKSRDPVSKWVLGGVALLLSADE